MIPLYDTEPLKGPMGEHCVLVQGESKCNSDSPILEGIKVVRPVTQPRLGQALHLCVRNLTMWKNIVRRIGETTGFQDVVKTRMDTYFFCTERQAADTRK